MAEARAQRLAELEARLKTVPERSRTGGQAVNLGSMWERLLPCTASFCFSSNDCRSIFDPIDYIVFEGLGTGAVSRIVFLEVKTGGSRLTPKQREIRCLVESKRVSTHIYPRGSAI
ncbi:MAG: Holliday junction resolvase-like protein [Acidobacteriaceae bacterium]